MKAEIGFVRDFDTGKVTERLELTVRGESPSDDTLLKMFAARIGCGYDQTAGKIVIREQPKATETNLNAVLEAIDKPCPRRDCYRPNGHPGECRNLSGEVLR